MKTSTKSQSDKKATKLKSYFGTMEKQIKKPKQPLTGSTEEKRKQVLKQNKPKDIKSSIQEFLM
jgi:hypothetical protein